MMINLPIPKPQLGPPRKTRPIWWPEPNGPSGPIMTLITPETSTFGYVLNLL